MKRIYKKIKPGDKIEVIIDGKKEIGSYVEGHERGILLLKLDNGYNIGFNKENISDIKIIKKFEKIENVKELKIKNDKPMIDFYLTGGTISSKLDPATGGVSNLINSEEFFSIYPEIFDIANVRIKAPFSKQSEDMIPSDWIRMAKLVGKSLNDSEVKGVIISHGTDTLHFSASALSFMLGKLNKPVIFTYSQRSSDRGSSDSRLNIICSAYAALSDIAEVMLVGHADTNDNYCHALQGNKCRKMHSSKRDAFRPINCRPFAKIFPDGKIENIRSDFNKRNKEKVNVDAVFDGKAAIFKFHPGADKKLIDFYRKNFKGLIIEGTGLGHVSINGKNGLIYDLKKAISKGLFVYMTSQTIYGRVNPYVYSSGRKLMEIGVVYLEDILPETAFVKLGWVLGHKEWRGSVVTKIKMIENISNEFNDRLGNEFLN